MKLIYAISFIVALLVFLTGAFIKSHVYLSSFWTDLILGIGILLSFAAFAGALLEGEDGLESA